MRVLGFTLLKGGLMPLSPKLGALVPVKCCKSIVQPPSLAACGLCPLRGPPLVGRAPSGQPTSSWESSAWQPGQHHRGWQWPPCFSSTGPWGGRAAAAASRWTEQRCAGWPHMWGGQKGTFRDGKSRGGRKELVVLPHMLLALNKRLLVLQLPVL